MSLPMMLIGLPPMMLIVSQPMMLIGSPPMTMRTWIFGWGGIKVFEKYFIPFFVRCCGFVSYYRGVARAFARCS